MFSLVAVNFNSDIYQTDTLLGCLRHLKVESRIDIKVTSTEYHQRSINESRDPIRVMNVTFLCNQD